MRCYTQADPVEGKACSSLCILGGPGHSVWHLNLTPTPASLLSVRFWELPRGRPAFACKVQWQKKEIKIMAPGPQLCEARGRGVKDRFSFYKYGQWSPGRAQTGGQERPLQWAGQTGPAECKGQSFQLSSDHHLSRWSMEGGLCRERVQPPTMSRMRLFEHVVMLKRCEPLEKERFSKLLQQPH